jgi:hypothetical protein
MQIVLTAFVTILVGALTLVAGQITVRGAIEPALELKRLIGTIAHDIDFYANRFLLATPNEQQEWRDRFRKHACSLREKLTVIRDEVFLARALKPASTISSSFSRSFLTFLSAPTLCIRTVLSPWRFAWLSLFGSYAFLLPVSPAPVHNQGKDISLIDGVPQSATRSFTAAHMDAVIRLYDAVGKPS